MPKKVAPHVFVPVVVPLYGRRGAAMAMLGVFSGADASSPTDNVVGVGLSSWTYPGKYPTATADRFAGNFEEAYGAYYGRAQTLSAYYLGTVLDIAQPLGAIDPAAVQVIANGISLGTVSDNPAGVSLRATAATGLFRGRFKAQTAAGETHSVGFMGVLVPNEACGEGFFLYPDAAWRAGYNLKRSYLVEIH